MPNLSDALQLRNFERALSKCERHKLELTEWEQSFIESIRSSFEERETMIDIGRTAWNPSANQWNTLMGIKDKLG